MVGLALDIGTREWKSDDVIVADAPVVAAPSVVAEAPVVAETFVERQPPTVEIKVEPKPTMQLTAPVMSKEFVETSATHDENQSRGKAYTTGGT